MTSLLQLPSASAQSPKDSGSSSTMVSLEENNYSPTRPQTKVNGADARKYSDSSLPSATAHANSSVTQKPTKTTRRSSLGLSLLGGKSDSNKSGKRRSSIAVVFLGRRNSKVCSERRRTYGVVTNTSHFVVKRTDDREDGKVQQIFRIRRGKRSASYDYNYSRVWTVDSGKKTTKEFFVGHKDGTSTTKRPANYEWRDWLQWNGEWTSWRLHTSKASLLVEHLCAGKPQE
jgi:hypothetical protein